MDKATKLHSASYRYMTSAESLIRSIERFQNGKLNKCDISVIMTKHKDLFKKLDKLLKEY